MSRDEPPRGPLTPAASESLVSGRRPFATRDGMEILGRRYAVERILGQGSMGVVLLGRDRGLDRPVAIKVIRPDVITLPGVVEAFTTEARAIARVRHPGVVQIHELGHEDGNLYFTTEYIDGPDLETWLDTQLLPLGLDGAMQVLDPLCQGVQAIHDAGAVHRDLKPGNILMGPSGRVAIADFGLSVITANPSWRQRMWGGTPEYMAPEIAQNLTLPDALLPAADIYALACIAYELLAGRVPFEGNDAHATMRLQIESRPQPPSEVNPALPDAFDAPILAALTKDPRGRTASASELRAGLIAALERATQPTDWSQRDIDILIVDDDPDMLDWLCVHLSDRFPAARLRRATHGAAALALAREQMPDLVLSDLDMPGVDGAGLTEALRDLPDGLTVPLIVVSAVGGAMDWARLQALGANGFLLKPLQPDTLASMIRAQLDTRDPS